MITLLFDTETTGLLKPKASPLSSQPEIIEIYALKVQEDVVDGKRTFLVLGELESFIKPSKPLPAEIPKITGITDSMLEGAPSFAQLQPKITEFFFGAHRIVAHNLAFDRGMLVNELSRLDKQFHFPWAPSHICTVEKSMKYEQRRLNLTRLHEELFGEGFPGAHRAKNDVLPLYRCYKKMVELEDII
jgi:DNA polymerase-3 subunit alpha (Gram-positive type)